MHLTPAPRPISSWFLVACALALLLGFALIACGDDDGDTCTDPCGSPGALRCGGAVIQQCEATADGCGRWADVQDCGANGQVCLSPPGSDPSCGVLCTDQCSTGGSQCSGTVVQQCEANNDGCLRWVDSTDCADATQVCDVVSGDASCVAP